MKTFKQWIKDKNLNEAGGMSRGSSAALGGLLGGLPGAVIGYHLGSDGASSSGSSSYQRKEFDPNAPWWNKDLLQYIPGTDAHSAAKYHRDNEQRKKEYEELVAKGMRPEDAKHYISYKDSPDFATGPLGISYFKTQYPDIFG